MTFDYFEVDIARTPGIAARRRQNPKKEEKKPDPIRVAFPLADVDRAHLIAELNFKG